MLLHYTPKKQMKLQRLYNIIISIHKYLRIKLTLIQYMYIDNICEKQKAPTSWMLKLYNSNYTAITISPLVLILFLVSRKLRLLAPRVVRSPCSPSFAILPQHSLAFVRLFRHRRRSQRSLPRRHGSSRFYAKQKAPTSWMLFVWRRRGDSTSRAGFPPSALSRGASSPT